jgi:peptidase E
MRRILAIGGYSSHASEAIAAAYIRDLTGKPQPKVCLLSTPSGDAPQLIRDFDRCYGGLGCETSNVSFFHPVGKNFVHPDNALAHLLAQDAIFVSGGHPRCALGLWKEWALDEALQDAWQHGVLLSGMSAGAICWFEHHVPPPLDRHLPLQKYLGFLPLTCDVHYHFGDGTHRQEVWDSMRQLALPSALAIDDDAAVMFEDDAIAEVLSWREGATAYQLTCHSAEVDEVPLAPKVIGSIPPPTERAAIEVDPKLKRACVGRYQLVQPIGQMIITMEGNHLFAQYDRQQKAEIFAESETRYFLKVVDAQITFERGSNGDIVSFVHHQNGRSIHATKVDN